jgi:hypothetical protein
MERNKNTMKDNNKQIGGMKEALRSRFHAGH